MLKYINKDLGDYTEYGIHQLIALDTTTSKAIIKLENGTIIRISFKLDALY